MNFKKDLKGQVFGRLTVKHQVGKNDWGNSIWLCECECGEKKKAVYQHLTQGTTRSCGCLRKKKVETK